MIELINFMLMESIKISSFSNNKNLKKLYYKMSITYKWSNTPMMICDPSASEQAKQLNMTDKKH